jgi:hypothetical protein
MGVLYHHTSSDQKKLKLNVHNQVISEGLLSPMVGIEFRQPAQADCKRGNGTKMDSEHQIQ